MKSNPPASTPAATSTASTSTDTSGNQLFHADTYSLTTVDGGKVTFALPTLATDPAVAPIEAYRKAVHAAPVTYIVADADNRQGSQNIAMSSVKVFDQAGKKIEFTGASAHISDWSPDYGSDGKYRLSDGTVLGESDGGLYNRGVELNNANLQAVEPGERRNIVIIAPVKALPSEFTRVMAMPGGYDSEQMVLPKALNDQISTSMPTYNCPRYQGPTCGVEVPGGHD
ncbi:hypothetical protein BGP79_11985 [Tersicoccus sp. Bi-70]|nr:hypothetical protein BGP79_11985 [Tersicoccus sp. Bi-70]